MSAVGDITHDLVSPISLQISPFLTHFLIDIWPAMGHIIPTGRAPGGPQSSTGHSPFHGPFP